MIVCVYFFVVFFTKVVESMVFKYPCDTSKDSEVKYGYMVKEIILTGFKSFSLLICNTQHSFYYMKSKGHQRYKHY